MKHLVNLVLVGIFITMPVFVLPAAAEDINMNTVRIWPTSNSLLFVSHDINIDIAIHTKLDSPMRKVSVIFDGSDVTPLLGKFALPEITLDAGLLRLSIPPFTLSSGVHTVYVEITTASGLVISDTVVYNAIDTFPLLEAVIPILGPSPYGWPCILPDTPCE